MLQSVSVWSSGNVISHISKVVAQYVGFVLVSCSPIVVTILSQYIMKSSSFLIVICYHCVTCALNIIQLVWLVPTAELTICKREKVFLRPVRNLFVLM